MSLTESIFEIHSKIKAKSDQKTADELIRLIVNDKIRTLQEEGRFSPSELERELMEEASSFSHWKTT